MRNEKRPEIPGRALAELKAHLQENGVDADPRQVATAFIALAREKVNRQGDAALLAWIEQLAIDVVQP